MYGITILFHFTCFLLISESISGYVLYIEIIIFSTVI